MTNEEIIKKATEEIKSVIGYRFTPSVLEATVEAGLQDGDKICIGGGVFVELAPTDAIFSKDGKEIRKVSRIEINGEMMDTLLKCKAKSASIQASMK